MRNRIVRWALSASLVAVSLLVPATGVSAVGVHHASPYARALTTVPGTGRTYTALSYSWFEADGFRVGKNTTDFNTVPPLAGSQDLKMRGGALFHEYGLSDLSAVSIHVPYLLADAVTWNGTRQSEQEGVGDITARYRHLFRTAGLDLALALGFKAPGNHNALGLNSPTKGQTDLFIEGAASTQMENGLYGELAVGYRWRLGVPDNDMTAGAELGWKSPFGLTDVTPRAFYDVTSSNGGLDLNSPSFNAAAANSGLPATRETRRVVGGAVTYDYKSLLFGFSYARSLEGRNTDNGQTFTLSAGMRY